MVDTRIICTELRRLSGIFMQEKTYVCNMHRKNSCMFYQIYFYSIESKRNGLVNIDANLVKEAAISEEKVR